MKRTFAPLLLVGLVSAASAAYAQTQPAYQPAPSASPAPDQRAVTPQDYSSSTTSPTKHEVMKDCIAREQAGNSTMSKGDAKKACHDAMKAQKDARSSTPDSEPRP